MNAFIDPLVALFAKYREQADFLNTAGEKHPNFARVDTVIHAALAIMCNAPPQPASLEGVAAAIQRQRNHLPLPSFLAQSPDVVMSGSCPLRSPLLMQRAFASKKGESQWIGTASKETGNSSRER